MSHASANGQRPLPPGWEWRPLGDFLVESRIPGSSGVDARKLTVKLYGKGVEAKSERRIGSENTRYYVRRGGQFIYSKLDFLNGAFGIIPEHLDGYESTLDVPAFDIRPGIEPAWVLAYVAREEFYEAQTQKARGGRKARRLAPEDLLRIHLPVPPKAEQQLRLAAISNVRETLAGTRAVVAQLERAANALSSNLLQHTAHKEWPMKQIGDLCSLSGGTGFGPATWSESGLPIIRIQNLNGSTRFNYFDGPPEDDWIVEPGDLLFAWAGVRGVSFGPTIWSGPRGLLNQHIYRVRPAEGVSKRWLYEILRAVTHRIESRAHGFKASLLHVHKKEITGQLVPVPPKREQQRIAAASEALETARRGELSALEAFEATATLLVSHLVAGGTTE